MNTLCYFNEKNFSVEVIIYIAEIEDFTPTFPFPWTLATPQIIYTIPEEPPIGARLLTVTAKNPSRTGSIAFEKIDDKNNYVSIDQNTGENKILFSDND